MFVIALLCVMLPVAWGVPTITTNAGITMTCGGSATTCTYVPNAQACTSAMTQQQAEQACAASFDGATLCTSPQLMAGSLANNAGTPPGSGAACNVANKLVWTSTSCTQGSTTGFWAVPGHGNANAGNPQPRCDTTINHYAVCCIDTGALVTVSPGAPTVRPTAFPTFAPSTGRPSIPTTQSPTPPTVPPTLAPTTQGVACCESAKLSRFNAKKLCTASVRCGSWTDTTQSCPLNPSAQKLRQFLHSVMHKSTACKKFLNHPLPPQDGGVVREAGQLCRYLVKSGCFAA